VRPDDLLYDRNFDFEFILPGNQPVHSSQKDLRELRFGSPWSPDAIRPLLKDKDPRVRTLGIVLLFDLNRLDVFQDMAGMIDDHDQTFPEPVLLQVFQPNAKRPPPTPATVGQYARLAIEPYEKYPRDLREFASPTHPDADTASQSANAVRPAPEHDPSLCTAVLMVGLDQAMGRMSPLLPERMARVQAVFNRVWQVPMPRRFFLLLAMNFDEYRYDKYPPDALLQLARQIPRDLRLSTINGQPFADDPEIDPSGAYHYFLDNAVDLLQKSDADTLLQLEQAGRDKSHERGYPNGLADPRLVIAAAKLRPEQADAILSAGLQRFNGEFDDENRMIISATLAQLGSDAGISIALDWFFSDSSRSDGFGGGRDGFLDRLHTADPIRFRKVAARIIRDSRFKTLGPPSTRILIESVEGYLGRSLSTDQETRDSYGGTKEFQDRAKFPPLEKWQKELHDTVDEWDPRSL
jgi:hypothetical protein